MRTSLALWACLAVSASLSAQGLAVPLTVQEPAGIARTAEPVTVGVPLPRDGGVASVDRLGLFDGDVAVPAQFRVLSRWDGLASDTSRPIRWVLVDFQSTLAANGARIYTLRDTGAGNAGPQGLSLDTSDPAAWVVRTGAIDVRIPTTRGAIVDRVVLGGRVILDDASPARSFSGVTLVDGNGAIYRTANAPCRVVLEEQGPMRLVVRVDADLATSSGAVLHPGEVHVVTRLTFYAGRPFFRARAELQNNGVYGDFDGAINEASALRFDSLRLDLPLALADARTVRTQGYESTAGAVDAFRVYQSHQVVADDDESQNFSYAVTRNGTQVASGARHDGWLEVTDGVSSVSASVRWFWQNYEKALRADRASLSIELWPSEGSWPTGTGSYLFEGGRHKSHEVLLSFAGDAAGQARRLASPLVPRAAPRWYFQTGALGMTDPGDLAFSGTGDDARMNAAYRRYNDLMRMRVGAVAPDAGRENPVRTIVDAKERRFQGPGTWMDWYGWANFGDDVWGDGYSSNHYDLPGFLMTHFLRLGDRAFWDVAEAHVRQATEYGQNWGIDANPYVASISFYEKTSHGLAAEWQRPSASHNWIRRLVLYHWLTGDTAARDAALFNAEALWRYFQDGFDITQPTSFSLTEWSPLAETRHMTWTLENWMEVYAMTGDPRWMQGCEDIVRCLLYKFQQWGHLEGGNPRTLGGSLMSHYASEPLVRFHQVCTNQALKNDLLAMMRGMLRASYEVDVVDAQGSGTSYEPARIAEDWDAATGPEDTDTIFNGFAASLYAYVGWVDGNAAYVAKAHRLWADGVFYPEYYAPWPERQTRNRDAFDTWGWASSQFPNSDEKVFSRETREGIPYLWVMSQGSAPVPPSPPPPPVRRPPVRIGLGAHATSQGQVASFAWDGSAFAPGAAFRLPWSAYDAAVGEVRPAGGDVDGDGREEYALGEGRYPALGGYVAIVDDEAAGFALLRWVRVPNAGYIASNGETCPALGDIDGDGQAELAVGLGRGGNGWVYVYGSANESYALRRQIKLPWTDYDALVGAVSPCVADVDGDGRAEVLAGLDAYPASGGRFAVLDPIATTAFKSWHRLPWAAYNAAEGSTRPCAADLDGDGQAEVVVGLGPYPANGGWMHVRRGATGGWAAVGWVRLPWAAYDAASGATRPSARDVDGDGRAELLVGIGRYADGGAVLVLDDLPAQYRLMATLRVGDAAYRSGNGETWPVR